MFKIDHCRVFLDEVARRKLSCPLALFSRTERAENRRKLATYQSPGQYIYEVAPTLPCKIELLQWLQSFLTSTAPAARGWWMFPPRLLRSVKPRLAHSSR